MKSLSLLLFSMCLTQALGDPLDKTRPHLDKLSEKSVVKYDNYEFPYLTMQTARVFDGKTEDVKRRLEKALESGRFTGELSMPETFTKGEQLEAVEECSAKKCNAKLLLASEAKEIEKVEGKQKLALYQKKIAARWEAYLNQGSLTGYEDRANNAGAMLEMAKQQEFLKLRYPSVASFIFSEGWKNRNATKKPYRMSFLKNETVVIAPEKLQPIWRIGELFGFDESQASVYFYLHVYTNHYFDASVAFYEVFPFQDKAVVVLTDVLEVDELKKSGFIRALFKGKMRDAVSASQDAFLKTLE